jgi:phage terminase large subunit-like protein
MTISAFSKIIGQKPHKTQMEVLKVFYDKTKEAREIVICAGRRWGKTFLCAFIVAKEFIEMFQEVQKGNRDSIKIWLVAPTYDLAGKVFEYIVKFLSKAEPRILNYVKNKPYPNIEISKSIWIQCKSAENPESLLGEELDLLIVDEAANISKKVWFDYLIPTTASKSRKGKTIFISTPRGINWFYELYQRKKLEGTAFHFTSLDGVEIDEKEWERLKKESPADDFKQNFEAVFLENYATVFRYVDDIIVPDCLKKEPEPGKIYVGGLDLAQIRDFTVLTIFDKLTHRQVFFDRFQKIPYTLQLDRIENAAKKFNATIIVELNNVGLAVADELRERGVKIQDFHTTGTIGTGFSKEGTKEQLIRKLAVDIENKNIFLAPIEQQIEELKAYGYQYTPTKHIYYGAPEGMHDDCVMAIALANWGLHGKTREEKIQKYRSIIKPKRVFQYR